MKSVSRDQAMAEQFHADPGYAEELLGAAGQEDESAEMAILLRQKANAFWQNEVSNLADTDNKPSHR
ncbi:transcriptional regulator [Pseudomonas syringae group sp. 247E2]|uniref:transcriptional regulator n=1 Tax=Pseudomonas syringae group sp. 247E2 TaxID=3079592 RepID=UPI00291305AF|nr:transcriptional regulator [Pseudomonas syringae group sp. 247E2]MDU8607617.1 transcriptional regulator [Pseudomonas syringae group sp. 247E2]